MRTAGNGLCGVKVLPEDVPQFATGIRYKVKLVQCALEGPGVARRILFSPKHVQGPPGSPPLPGPRDIEAAIFSFGAGYKDSDATLKWPPGSEPNSHYIDRASLWLRIGSDANAWPTAPVGMRPANKCTRRLFPRGNFGIDNREDLTSIEAIGQFPIIGEELDIKLERKADKVFRTPITDWGGRYVKLPNGNFTSTIYLPPGTYACWRMIVDDHWVADFVLPLGEATQLNPWEASSWFTEFWNYDDKPIAVEVWDVAIKTSLGWTSKKRFDFHFPSESNGSVPYGPLVNGNGRLELSNVRAASAYAQHGDILILP